jgi:hypothetical protein
VAITLLPEERVEVLTRALREEASTLDPGERLHTAVLPTESFV